MTVTIAVKPQHRFNEARLHEFLQTNVEDYAGPIQVSQFEGGQSNPTFLVQTPQCGYVLRRKPPGVLVKIHPTEPRVAAVLDWELSTIGDPLADFTYFTGPWHADPGERSYSGLDLALLGIPAYEDLVARYCERSGLQGIPHERYYRAFHAFRSAAILQGIIRRAMQGNNAGDMALTFTPDNVRALAQRGMQHAAAYP